MTDGYIIGLDFGTQSARGVLVNAASGKIEASSTHPYRHGVMTSALPDGTPLPTFWALQIGADYTEAAESILGAIGRGKTVHGIGLGFTASSPMPVFADGTALSERYPDQPHAYVKLWKHQAAQPWVEELSAHAGDSLANFGGKLSAEWLFAKAAQLAAEAPDLWRAADRFIEAGDWLVWQLTGHECRSLGLAAYKAQYLADRGYPKGLVSHLDEKLGQPFPIGSSAGGLSDDWRRRTGIVGKASVAVAVIDSHVVMPAVGAADTGTLVGALGTSAVFLLLDTDQRPLPMGIEGVAQEGVLPGFWCYEAGQASFGDTLDWFVRASPLADTPAENFKRYNEAASRLAPGQNHLLALDWWNGCRVPFGDSSLSGLLVGLNLRTTSVDIYRALLESFCYGARSIAERLVSGGAPIKRIVLTSGLAQNNPFLMQLMADILGRTVEVPQIDHSTAVGAAIHGAVAAGVVESYAEGARLYGARDFVSYAPSLESRSIYDNLFEQYLALSADETLKNVMKALNAN